MAERWEMECENAIQAARRKVAAATDDYRKGGSVNALNKANRELADCHYRWREVCGGLVPDER